MTLETFYKVLLMLSLKKEKQLFTKNTSLCKFEKIRIRAEICPVSKNEARLQKQLSKIPINGGSNSDCPKVAKFLGG